MATRTKHISVLVALSGGVDSAVSAYLLANSGFRIVGGTFKLWEYSATGIRRNNLCCSAEGISAAKALCEKLDCEHIVKDVSQDFFDNVVSEFLHQYECGQTPNPCVFCNPTIKWKHLSAIADEMGIEKVATGHYARTFASQLSGRNLLRGADSAKDQSYFLYRLGTVELARTLFPVGHLTKQQTRSIAEFASLPISSPYESQELCFLPNGGLEQFFRQNIPHATKQGWILDSSGKRVGKHSGIAFFTIGQRSGLGGGFSQPMYVVKILPDENAIVIGTKDELLRAQFEISNIVLRRKMDREFRCTVRIRHRHQDAPATVILQKDSAKIAFDQAQRGITPGQSAVLYDGLAVIGGGIIR